MNSLKMLEFNFYNAKNLKKATKIRKNDYICTNLTEKKDFDDDKIDYSFYKKITILINILLIVLAFAYIWSYKYMKYLANHETEWINVAKYNRKLYWNKKNYDDI